MHLRNNAAAPPIRRHRNTVLFRGKCWSTFALSLTVILGLGATIATAQPMPKDEYLSHLTLHYPRLVRQVPANVRLQIYGDDAAPGYVDVNPRDGIDDARGKTFRALGKRFAPYLVLNTTEMPLDFKIFMDQRSAFKLYVDTWNLSDAPKEIIGEETIDFNALLSTPCDGNVLADTKMVNDDCRLRALLAEFDPDNPTADKYTSASVDAYTDLFKVIYWDFPG